MDEVIAGIGPKIYLLRQGEGLSLQQLAERSGVSAAAIHKMERNAMVPTITTLMKLARALGRSVGYFIEEGADGTAPAVLVRAKDRDDLLPSPDGVNRQNLAGPFGRFALSAAIVTIAPGLDSGKAPLAQPGEELVYLLSGSMEFEIDTTYQLRQGDSLHLRTDHPHRWRNPSARPAKAVWISLRVPSLH
ncbi:cupin domain-containing protein [Terrabacter sp. MAHUQ-38]|uniref:cupin domain-containing protein n=1 Tax=unclassified Terrabacter TaxID=2630222 RepID=UPI00165E377B|nr:cupin domain-containing protein [Terrabacter sp. MAHUQ-38]MBC9822903.1 helix-turn-helix domain-containing protein [Terrabacter sp. MAHUQ-38]